MNKELAKTLTTALVQFIDSERPEGSMCCSSYECEKIEKAFEGGTYDVVEKLIKRKLTGLTEFESSLRQIIEETLSDEVPNGSGGTMSWAVGLSDDDIKKLAPKVLALAKKEMPLPEDTVIFQKGVEEGRRLEREEATKRSIQGYGDGKQDALRMVKDFVESHFNYENAKKGTPIVYNTQSGTSTLKAEG